MDMNNYRKIMAGREELLSALNKGVRSWTNIAAINIIFPDSTHVSPNQACHAGLSNNRNGNKKSGSIAVVSALMKPKAAEVLYEEEAHYFLDWLLNRSPYSSTFIIKSAEEALYYKAIVSSSDHPSNLMAAGLVASRRLWEYPHIARVMVDLAKVGVNEDLAFYLSHIFRGSFDRSGSNNDWGGCSSAHCSIDPGIMGKEELFNFLSHQPTNLNELFSKKNNYYGYDAMYGVGAGYNTTINKKFPYKGAAKAAVNVNPFPIAAIGGVEKGKSSSYQDLIKHMADYQHVILDDIGFKKQEKAA